MLGTYSRVLKTPGAWRFTTAGTLGRLPLSMTALGIVLLVEVRTDSYAQAGVAAAGYTLAMAVGAPLQGRLADRWGQSRILAGAAFVFCAGLLALLAMSSTLASDQGIVWATACATFAGLGAPQTGNMVRRRWTHVLDDRSQLQTAFALEAVLDEAVFIIGPVLVTFLAINVHPLAGLGVAAGAAGLGAGLLAVQRATQPPATHGAPESSGPLPWGVLAPVVAAAVFIGIMFGSVEILVVAFAEEQGHKTWAGLILAVWAIGSLAAGIVVGMLPAAHDPVAWLRTTTMLLALFFLPVPFAPNLWWLVAGMLLTGIMISPTLIGAVNLVEQYIHAGRLTEALTWLSTGLAVGIAPGALISGWVIDGFGAAAGLWVPVLAASTTAILARLLNLPASHRRPA